MLSQPVPGPILHVEFTPAEARAMVRGARHLKLVRRGRVVYEPGEIPAGVRGQVEGCIDGAERAAPVAR